jgi:putative DNA primase/helicase
MTTTAARVAIAEMWSKQAPVLTASTACIQCKWSVIPLDLDKRPVKTGGTFPDGNLKRLRWKPYQERLANEQEIRIWQKKYTPTAWGVVTGSISGIVVLDFDGEKGKATLEQLGLSPHVRTGSGGFHVYFKHPDWHVPTLNSKSKEELGRRWPGTDIRADGGYAAFCGYNASGRYQWLREPILEDLSILPDDIREFLGLLSSPEEKSTQQAESPTRRSGSPVKISDRLLDKALDRIGFDGRDNACFWLACQMRDNDISRSQAESQVCEFARRCPSTNTKGQPEPFTERDALVKLNSAYTRPAREAWKSNDTQEFPVSRHIASNGNGNHSSNGHTDLAEGDTDFILDCLNQNEWGDALLFAHLYCGKVIYDHTEEKWYHFHNHTWHKDLIGKVKHYVSGKLASAYIRTAAVLVERARESNEKEKIDRADKHAKALLDRALKLRSVARCRNVLIFASSQEGMGITAEQWDTNKWLLAVPNGVIDLHNGTCRNGKPDDYIRTVAPTPWQGLDAPAPRFERFLEELFEDRGEDERIQIINFLQRLLGYGVTGETREHVFVVLYGEDGRNGKDTLQRAISHALGEVSGAISKDVLLDTGRQHAAGGATPHLCDLQGRRLAWASEPEKGARFSVGQVKELSGGGEIPVRPLYAKDYYKIQPTHLLILLTNHKPHADADDSALWDRLRLITFNMRFVDKPDPDKPNERRKDVTLWDTLEQEAAGILAWLIRGCLQWQKQGLDTPKCILEAGTEYRKEEDAIGQFIDERCDITDPEVRTLASHIFNAYLAWCEALNIKNKKNGTSFGRLLSKRFTKDEKPTRHGNTQGIHYHGIKLLPLSPDDDGGVKGLQESPKTITPAPQATSGPIKPTECEGCEGFLQEVTKSEVITSPYMGLPVKTLHTLHTNSSNDGIDTPVESVEDTVKGLKNPSQEPFRYPADAAMLAGPEPGRSCFICKRRRWVPRLKGEHWEWACTNCHPEVERSQGRTYYNTIDRGK